ncbi:MAG: hypothetical protein WCP28_17215 [Actinomycetes bacterium]
MAPTLYPTFEQISSELGDKIIAAMVAAHAQTVIDLDTYRAELIDFVSESSIRGHANWIHDRMFANLARLVDDHPDVVIQDNGTTRQIMVSQRHRIRVKRHHDDGNISVYETQTALEFCLQGPQTLFPELDEIRLMAGYMWDDATGEMGLAVLSLRDGTNNVVWVEVLPGQGEVVSLGGDATPQAPIIGIAEEDVRESGIE